MSTANKVYIIESDLSGPLSYSVTQRNALRDMIEIIAKNLSEPVFFHENMAPGGAPVIVLECSEKFLELVKGLPGYCYSFEAPSGLTTRSAPKAAKRPAPKRPGP